MAAVVSIHAARGARRGSLGREEKRGKDWRWGVCLLWGGRLVVAGVGALAVVGAGGGGGAREGERERRVVVVQAGHRRGVGGGRRHRRQ